MAGLTSTLDEPTRPASGPKWVPTVSVLWSAGRIREDSPLEVGRTFRIGREPEANDLVLDDPYVSRRHAVLRVASERQSAELENRSRRGSHVGSVQVADAPRPVADGDVMLIGRSVLLFRWQPRPTEDAAAAARLVGGAPLMRVLRARLAKVAKSTNVVCIQGETGTGKELVARTLHDFSERSGAFVAVNCAAIPDALAESLLFGHVGGAFTGAAKASPGYFRAAAQGTLFLDEIGELPLPQQAKLLRALETGCVAPLGSAQEVPHHARVLAATHRDLAEEVRAGRFRTDLYARVVDFVLDVPPLRERREDVLPLLRHAFGAPPPPLEFDLVRALLLHPWPLNVRELMRISAQLQTLGRGANALTLDLVEAALERNASLVAPKAPVLNAAAPNATAPNATAPNTAAPTADTPASSVPAHRSAPSRAELEDLLREHRGVVADVARCMGRSRKQVYRWARAHDIAVDDYRSQ